MKYYKLHDSGNLEICNEREFKQWVEGLDAHVQLAAGMLLFHDIEEQDGGTRVEVVTAFLGMNMSEDKSKVICFETKIVGGKHDGEVERYETRRAAELGHASHVSRVFR